LKFQSSGTAILTGYDKHKTHSEKCIDILSSIPTITKNDAKKLLNKYGSIAEVISAEISEFREIEGFGAKKVQVLKEVFTSSLIPN
jgi:ERCC4-type nuclease